MKIKHFLFAILIGFVFITACSDEVVDPRGIRYELVYDSVNNPYYQNLLIGKWKLVARKIKEKGEISYKEEIDAYKNSRLRNGDTIPWYFYPHIEFVEGGRCYSNMIDGGEFGYTASKNMLMLKSNSDSSFYPMFSLKLQNWTQNDTLLLEDRYLIYYRYYDYQDTTKYYGANVFIRVE